MLSEVIDIVQEVKQAHRKVPETHALHATLDQLSDDLRAWAQLLVERDEALGVSPLDRMPSVAGRKPPNLWPDAATDEKVRRLIDEHLDVLGQHVTAALAAQDDDQSRAAPELAGFLTAARLQRLTPALQLTAYNGMRRGEVVGLKWSDLDRTTKRLSIARTLQNVAGNPVEFDVKTRTSRRCIDIDDSTMWVLAQWRGGPVGVGRYEEA